MISRIFEIDPLARLLSSIHSPQDIREYELQMTLRDLPDKDPGRFRLSSVAGLGLTGEKNLDEFISLVSPSVLNADKFFSVPVASIEAWWNETSVSFLSPVAGYQIVSAEFFAPPTGRSAAILIPHWNANPKEYGSINRLLSLYGTSTCVMTLPYHGPRGRGHFNDFLTADLGGTINSVRQSVIEIRTLVNILKRRGFSTVSLIGISLGSCIAALTCAFEPEIDGASLLLTAGDFADVVWRGGATKRIADELKQHMELSDLQKAWQVISPSTYASRIRARHIPMQILLGDHDGIVPTDLGLKFADAILGSKTADRLIRLACGHYSLGRFPYNLIAIYHCRKLLQSLQQGEEIRSRVPRPSQRAEA